MAINRAKLTGMKTDHSCCKETEISGTPEHVKSFKSYAAGAVAAFLACLCCSVPLIPLMLGLSGALAFRDQLGPYHQAFEAGAIGILLSASFYMWRQHKKSGKPLRSFVLHMAVTLGMYSLMSFVMNQLVMPAMAGTNIHSGIHGNSAHGKM